MEQLTKNQAVATSQEAVQNQNEPQLRDENAHNDKSVHGVLNPTYQAGLRRDAVQPDSEAERKKRDEIEAGKSYCSRRFGGATCDDKSAQIYARFDKNDFRRKRSSPNVFEMAATETITSIILIKLIRVSLGTVRHPRRFKIVVIDIQITLKQMLRDFIGIRVNRAKKSGMVNITSSVNSRERSGINTILHELNPLFTINVTMRDIKSKNVYSRVNSKATTQWRKTESANGVHLEGVASDNRSS